MQKIVFAAALGLLSTSAVTPALAQDTPRPVSPSVSASMDSGTLSRAHPEMKTVLMRLQKLGAKPVSTLTVAQARDQPSPADAVNSILTDKNGGKPPLPQPVARATDVMIQGAAGPLKARVYWPMGETPNSALPVIVYFHGGGWVIATIDTYDASARALADGANAIVVSVEYCKAPEHQFPAAVDDAIAAYADVIKEAGKWNGDDTRIAVAGESAGGNLALDVALNARDKKLTMPKGILAVYPVASGDTMTASEKENTNAIPLSQKDILWFVGKYLTSKADATDPRVNIVGDDLKGLPPVTIVAAEIDPLRSDGEKLRDELKAAGNDVNYRLWDGVTHEFFGMGALVPEAKQAEAFASSQLASDFGK